MDNKLSYEERRLLQLYRYMLKQEYDVEDRRVYENSIELKNHIDMQHAIYLIYKMFWTNEYGFVWDRYGPKSIGLETNLNELDKKNNEIYDYYKDFDDNIYTNDSIKKLNEFYDYSKIKILEKFTKLIEDILKEEKGLELLADLAYIGKHCLPGAKFEVVNHKLQKYRPVFKNNDLNKYAFKCLEQFDFIEPIDCFSGKVKRLKN